MKQQYTRKLAIAAVTMLLACIGKMSGQQWSPRGPVPRSSHTAVYDSTTGRMIVLAACRIPTPPAKILTTFFGFCPRPVPAVQLHGRQ